MFSPLAMNPEIILKNIEINGTVDIVSAILHESNLLSTMLTLQLYESS